MVQICTNQEIHWVVLLGFQCANIGGIYVVTSEQLVMHATCDVERVVVSME